MFKLFRRPAKNKPPRGTSQIRALDARQSGWFLPDSGELFRGFPITADDVVVDVGCGPGHAACFAALRGAEVIATDIDPQIVQKVEKKLRRIPARAYRAVTSDSNPLPLPDAIGTRIICRDVLEHVDDPRQIMRELVRIGRPDALYLISVPDPVVESIQQDLAPPCYWEKPNHLRIIQREEFGSLVEEAGLTIERRDSWGFYWSMWWILFWASNQELGDPEKPLLRHWTQTWQALITSPEGPRIKRALDDRMPKSQVVVARKAA